MHPYRIFGILNWCRHKLPSVNHGWKQSKSAPMTSRGPVSIHGVETADVPETDPSLTFNMQEIAAREGTWKHPEHLINNTYQNCWRDKTPRWAPDSHASRLQQHQVWRNTGAHETNPWARWKDRSCVRGSSEAGHGLLSSPPRFTGANQWSIECARVAQHVRVIPGRLLNLSSHKVMVYGNFSVVKLKKLSVWSWHVSHEKKENWIKQSVLEEANFNSSIKSASHAQELGPLLSMFRKDMGIFTQKICAFWLPKKHAVTQRR